jgi:hypothetical protein
MGDEPQLLAFLNAALERTGNGPAESKVDEPKVDEPKVDEPKVDEPKVRALRLVDYFRKITLLWESVE